jgi:hypothetical protein
MTNDADSGPRFIGPPLVYGTRWIFWRSCAVVPRREHGFAVDGFCSPAFRTSPLLVTLVAEQSGINRAGSAAGIANAVWQAGSAMLPAVVGLVFQASHSFQMAFAALAVGPLLGAICMLFVKEHVSQ